MVAAGVHCAAQQQTEAPRQGSAPAATPSSSAAKPESNPFYDELKQPWQLYRAGKLENAAAGFRMVFLSACRSGLGLVSGDGIFGLTRAFLYAGTPSVIASLWDVADAPTYRLISSFYRSWLQGSNKGAALRSAQLGLLRALRAQQIRIHTASGDVILPEDPVFWASFVLQGAP